MRLLKITELNQSFADKLLFRDAELFVNSGDRIALVGPNGCGKSTLMKIVAGTIVPDSYKTERNENLRIGYLDQYAEIGKSVSVRAYLRESFAELYEKERGITEIYTQVAQMSEREQNETGLRLL